MQYIICEMPEGTEPQAADLYGSLKVAQVREIPPLKRGQTVWVSNLGSDRRRQKAVFLTEAFDGSKAVVHRINTIPSHDGLPVSDPVSVWWENVHLSEKEDEAEP